MIKLFVGLMIGLLIGGLLGFVVNEFVNQPVNSKPIIKNVITQNCSISECQKIIQDAYYDVNYAKHCLENPEKIECMR